MPGPDFERMYFKLFAAAVDAVDEIDRGNFLKARTILISAQLEGEEAYCAGDSTDE